MKHWKPKFKKLPAISPYNIEDSANHVSKTATCGTKDKGACVEENVEEGFSANLPSSTNLRATHHLERPQTSLLDLVNDIM